MYIESIDLRSPTLPFIDRKSVDAMYSEIEFTDFERLLCCGKTGVVGNSTSKKKKLMELVFKLLVRFIKSELLLD